MSAAIRDRYLIEIFGLAPERVAFVRYLIATGRITDGRAPPPIVDTPLVLPHWQVPARTISREERC